MKTTREICVASGISRKALRVYQSRGLIEPHARTAQGYWLYDNRTIEQIHMIRLLQIIGYTLAEIGRYQKSPMKGLDPSPADKLEKFEKERRQAELSRQMTEKAIQLMKESPDGRWRIDRLSEGQICDLIADYEEMDRHYKEGEEES